MKVVRTTVLFFILFSFSICPAIAYRNNVRPVVGNRKVPVRKQKQTRFIVHVRINLVHMGDVLAQEALHA